MSDILKSDIFYPDYNNQNFNLAYKSDNPQAPYPFITMDSDINSKPVLTFTSDTQQGKIEMTAVATTDGKVYGTTFITRALNFTKVDTSNKSLSLTAKISFKSETPIKVGIGIIAANTINYKIIDYNISAYYPQILYADGENAILVQNGDYKKLLGDTASYTQIDWTTPTYYNPMSQKITLDDDDDEYSIIETAKISLDTFLKDNIDKSNVYFCFFPIFFDTDGTVISSATDQITTNVSSITADITSLDFGCDIDVLCEQYDNKCSHSYFNLLNGLNQEYLPYSQMSIQCLYSYLYPEFFQGRGSLPYSLPLIGKFIQQSYSALSKTFGTTFSSNLPVSYNIICNDSIIFSSSFIATAKSSSYPLSFIIKLNDIQDFKNLYNTWTIDYTYMKNTTTLSQYSTTYYNPTVSYIFKGGNSLSTNVYYDKSVVFLSCYHYTQFNDGLISNFYPKFELSSTILITQFNNAYLSSNSLGYWINTQQSMDVPISIYSQQYENRIFNFNDIPDRIKYGVGVNEWSSIYQLSTIFSSTVLQQNIPLFSLKIYNDGTGSCCAPQFYTEIYKQNTISQLYITDEKNITYPMMATFSQYLLSNQFMNQIYTSKKYNLYYDSENIEAGVFKILYQKIVDEGTKDEKIENVDFKTVLYKETVDQENSITTYSVELTPQDLLNIGIYNKDITLIFLKGFVCDGVFEKTAGPVSFTINVKPGDFILQPGSTTLQPYQAFTYKITNNTEDYSEIYVKIILRKNDTDIDEKVLTLNSENITVQNRVYVPPETTNIVIQQPKTETDTSAQDIYDFDITVNKNFNIYKGTLHGAISSDSTYQSYYNESTSGGLDNYYIFVANSITNSYNKIQNAYSDLIQQISTAEQNNQQLSETRQQYYMQLFKSYGNQYIGYIDTYIQNREDKDLYTKYNTSGTGDRALYIAALSDATQTFNKDAIKIFINKCYNINMLYPILKTSDTSNWNFVPVVSYKAQNMDNATINYAQSCGLNHNIIIDQQESGFKFYINKGAATQPPSYVFGLQKNNIITLDGLNSEEDNGSYIFIRTNGGQWRCLSETLISLSEEQTTYEISNLTWETIAGDSYDVNASPIKKSIQHFIDIRLCASDTVKSTYKVANNTQCFLYGQPVLYNKQNGYTSPISKEYFLQYSSDSETMKDTYSITPMLNFADGWELPELKYVEYKIVTKKIMQKKNYVTIYYTPKNTFNEKGIHIKDISKEDLYQDNNLYIVAYIKDDIEPNNENLRVNNSEYQLCQYATKSLSLDTPIVFDKYTKTQQKDDEGKNKTKDTYKWYPGDGYTSNYVYIQDDDTDKFIIQEFYPIAGDSGEYVLPGFINYQKDTVNAYSFMRDNSKYSIQTLCININAILKTMYEYFNKGSNNAPRLPETKVYYSYYDFSSDLLKIQNQLIEDLSSYLPDEQLETDSAELSLGNTYFKIGYLDNNKIYTFYNLLLQL